MTKFDIDGGLPQDWDQVSKTELIKIILQQQLRLKTLQATLHQVEQQQVGEESARPFHRQSQCPVNHLLLSRSRGWSGEEVSYLSSNNSLFPPLCAEIMLELGLQQELKQLTQLLLTEQHTKIERALRNALRFLHDPAYLDQSSLKKVVGEMRQIKIDGPGLQLMLTQAIERLRPRPNQLDYDKWQTRYDILCLTYREKQPLKLVITTLSLSERQYYRELKRAIEGTIKYL